MARLEAVAKALYYPTPDRVTGMIVRALKNIDLGYSTAGGYVLDPCCGDGTAVAYFGQQLGFTPLGIELHEGRAAEAATKFETVNAAFEQVETVAKSMRAVFLNPPYDYGAGTRQEVLFLAQAIDWLPPYGLLVYIVPRRILTDPDFVAIARAQLADVVAYSFPEPEVHAFDQIVIFARRRSGWAFDPPTEVEGVLSDETSFDFFVGHTEERFARFVVSQDCLYDETPAYDSAQFHALVGVAGLGQGAPLVRPRPGHQAMLLASGALDGAVLGGGRYLLKGGSEKVTYRTEEPAGEGKVRCVERERISSRLSVLDCNEKTLDTWRAEDDVEKTTRWFEENGVELARCIATMHAPSFTGDAALFARIDALHAPRPGARILPVQRETAAAVAHHWKTSKGAILSGEMGLGKSLISIAAHEAARARKVVVICPAHLVEKWQREIVAVTGERCARIGKRIQDVDQFFASATLRYLVLSKETAKLGARWRPAYIKTRISRVHEFEVRDEHWNWRTERKRIFYDVGRCPDCGAVQASLDENGELGLPIAISTLDDTKTRRTCVVCKTALWQVAPISARGTKRWPLAAYIGKRYAGRYALTIDECHAYAAPDTDQSVAVQDLAAGARKIVAMTGTFYGGRASSIFYLLYRVDHGFRQRYKFDECAKFVSAYGLLETVFPEQDARTSVYGYRKQKAGRVKEIPGMSPSMIPLILPFSIFVKLADLDVALPPYTEHVELVEPDPAIKHAATALQSALRNVLRKHPKALGAYLQAVLGYPDCSEQEENVRDPETGETLATAPALTVGYTTKDLRLLDIVREARAAGRKVLVYFTQTHRRDARQRVNELLSSNGFVVGTLEASVPPEKREAYVTALAPTIDVLLTNGRLVETGLDLLWATTIVQYGTEYSVASLRQSVRRSWRLGQTEPVNVHFLGFAGTMQEAAIDLIAKKMRAAEMVDGDETGGLGQHDETGNNFLVQLAQRVVGQER